MKPYIICHMMCSVDGRTLTENWVRIAAQSAYEIVHKKHNSNAWMCGRVTMERDFASNKPLKLKHHNETIAKEDFVADAKTESFAIAVDKHGKLNWDSADIDGDHLIVVLTEAVSNNYLHFLKELGASYIFAGKKEVDFKEALNKLRKLFGIEKLMLEGGGHLNGAMLDEGLIDELSLLYIPLADGTPDSTAVFEKGDNIKMKHGSKLELMNITRLEHDVVWIQYKVK